MPNEIDIIIKSVDKTGPDTDKAIARQRHVKRAVDDTAASTENLSKKTTKAGQDSASFTEGAQAGWGKLTVGVGAAVAAFAAANQMLTEGIGVQLASANAQVALGDSYGMLKQAADEQAHSLGMTTSEYEKAAGMTASLAKNMGFATDVAAQFGMMMPDLSNKLSLLSGGQVEAAAAADMMRAAMAGEFDPLQTLGINISAAIVQQKALNIQMEHGEKFTDQQATALAVLSIVQDQTADSTKVLATEAGKAAQAAQKNSAEMRQAWQDLQRDAVPILSAITQFLGDTIDALNKLGQVAADPLNFDKWGSALKGQVEPWVGLFNKIRGKTEETGDASAKAAPKVEDLAKEQRGSAKSAEQMAEATKEATDAISELADVALSARGAARDWEAALDEANASLKENGRTLDITTEKGRENQEALDAIAEAALAQAEAVREAGGSEAQFRSKLDQSRSALEKQAVKFGMTKKEAKAYADQVLGIPRSRNTDIKLSTQQALGQLAYLRGVIRGMDGTTIRVRAQAVLDDSAVRGIATGGVQGAAAGGTRSNMAWVGEHGPELVRLPPGSIVHSNPDSQRMVEQSAGTGGGRDVVVVEFKSDDPALLALMRRMVRVYGAGNTQTAFGDRRVRA